MWLTYARSVLLGAGSQPVDAMETLNDAERLARPYVLLRAIALRLVAEAALRDQWGEPARWLRDSETELIARSQHRIASACRTLLKQAGEPTTRRRGSDAEVPVSLLKVGVTAREAEVLDLLTSRLTNKEIAERLYLSPRTVEKHVASLLTKTHCSNRRDLIVWVTEHPLGR